MPVTKSISCGFQICVRLNTFQNTYSAMKIGMLMSAGQAQARAVSGCTRINRWEGEGEGRRTGCEEVGRVEVPEDGEAVDEDEDDDPEDAPDREVRLEVAVVHELLAVQALRLHSTVCIITSCKSAIPTLLNTAE